MIEDVIIYMAHLTLHNFVQQGPKFLATIRVVSHYGFVIGVSTALYTLGKTSFL